MFAHLHTTNLIKQVAAAGRRSNKYDLPPSAQEFVFLEERCEDEKSLADYGICEDFIVQAGAGGAHMDSVSQQAPWLLQVTGFVVNPEVPGKRLKQGVLVPCD